MDNGGAFTARLLEEAGIVAGMRVLDVGCGAGDVTLRLAALVGSEGRVVGLDRESGTLTRARERATATGATNVDFVEGDLDAGRLPDGPFDAVVGRRVLMYLRNPQSALLALKTVVRPNAVIAFQENDSALVQSAQLPPLHARIYEVLWKTIAREGANVHMGFALAPALRAAGFSIAGVRVEVTMLTPEFSPPVGQLVSAMLRRMIEAGATTPDEFDPATLDRQLAEERVLSGNTLPWETIFGVWARPA